MNSRTFTTPDGKYAITSYGNGWAYEVRCRQSNYSFFVQDHEADELQAVTENFEDTHPLDEYMSVAGTADREVEVDIVPTQPLIEELTEEEKWNRAFEYIKNQVYEAPNDLI